jgi:hypothetical protein
MNCGGLSDALSCANYFLQQASNNNLSNLNAQIFFTQTINLTITGKNVFNLSQNLFVPKGSMLWLRPLDNNLKFSVSTQNLSYSDFYNNGSTTLSFDGQSSSFQMSGTNWSKIDASFLIKANINRPQLIIDHAFNSSGVYHVTVRDITSQPYSIISVPITAKITPTSDLIKLISW